MPIIKRESIEAIRSKVNIYDVVSPYVNLKRSGSNWRGLSPFNEEKTPSFYVLPQKNIFKCFSSGHAGDIFKFVQLKEHLNFNEAVDWLARRFQLPIEYEAQNLPQLEQTSLRKELYTIHEIAQSYYQEAFRANNEIAGAIRAYFFNDRGFSQATADSFCIGYAPAQDRGLLSRLLSYPVSLNAIKQSGLFYCREADGHHPSSLSPRFKGRLMIPIRDVQGRTLAFSARQTPYTPQTDASHAAKYINSPETPIFSKSYVLFGLDRARKQLQDHQPFILVEGQLDVLRCHEQGLYTAVAPQGTAVTEQQLSLIRRYTHSLECFLDGDSAGQKAALRLLPLALAAGLDIHFLCLKPGEDPDSVLLQGGLDAYKTCQALKLGPMDFAYHAFFPQQASPNEKAVALEQIYAILKQCESVVARQAYLMDLARLASVDAYTLELDFADYIKKQNLQNKLASPKIDATKNKKNLSEKFTSADYELLLLLLHHTELIEPVCQVLDPEYINLSSLHGRLLSRFISEIREGIRDSFSPLEELLETEEEYNLIYTLMAQESPFANPSQSANACIRTIFSSYIQAKKKALEDRISAMPVNDVRLRPLLEERLSLRKIQKEAPQICI